MFNLFNILQTTSSVAKEMPSILPCKPRTSGVADYIEKADDTVKMLNANRMAVQFESIRFFLESCILVDQNSGEFVFDTGAFKYAQRMAESMGFGLRNAGIRKVLSQSVSTEDGAPGILLFTTEIPPEANRMIQQIRQETGNPDLTPSRMYLMKYTYKVEICAGKATPIFYMEKQVRLA